MADELVQAAEVGGERGGGAVIERRGQLADDLERVVERRGLGLDVAGGDRAASGLDIGEKPFEQSLDDLLLGGGLEVDASIGVGGADVHRGTPT